MAEFCTFCAEEIFGDGTKADIDVYGIFEKLDEGNYQSCICEGCSMIAIGKSNNKIMFYIGELDSWVDEDFEPIKDISNKDEDISNKDEDISQV